MGSVAHSAPTLAPFGTDTAPHVTRPSLASIHGGEGHPSRLERTGSVHDRVRGPDPRGRAPARRDRGSGGPGTAGLRRRPDRARRARLRRRRGALRPRRGAPLGGRGAVRRRGRGAARRPCPGRLLRARRVRVAAGRLPPLPLAPLCRHDSRGPGPRHPVRPRPGRVHARGRLPGSGGGAGAGLGLRRRDRQPLPAVLALLPRQPHPRPRAARRLPRRRLGELPGADRARDGRRRPGPAPITATTARAAGWPASAATPVCVRARPGSRGRERSTSPRAATPARRRRRSATAVPSTVATSC